MPTFSAVHEEWARLLVLEFFAKAINCEHPTADGEACNECESCKAFGEGRSYNIFELDAASNKLC